MSEVVDYFSRMRRWGQKTGTYLDQLPWELLRETLLYLNRKKCDKCGRIILESEEVKIDLRDPDDNQVRRECKFCNIPEVW